MSPGGDLVGSAYVEINIDASPGEAELAKLMSKADRDFAEFGRKHAEAEVSVKTADFDKKIDEAKSKLDYFKSRRASATLDLAKKHFDEQVAAAEAELKALGKQKATIQVDSKQLKAANKMQRLLTDARALDEKHAMGQAKAEKKLSDERSRATLEASKARAEIARLGDEYEKLRGRQKAIEKSSSRVFSPKSIGTADSERRALERVTAEADHVKNRIESLGGSVEGLDARMGKNTSLLDRWLSRLGDTSVRIGPITTSIKGLATGLGLLGPLLSDLAGGAGAVIGFLGSGIAGAASVGIAGLAGFATSAVGVGLVIKPLVHEFGEVKKAEEALTKAELKYGKGSTQVKTAQEQLNHELKGVSPAAKAAIQDYGKLGSEWANLTKAAKPAVFDAFGQGLKTVQALLPEFASESVATTKVAANAWTAWMKSLRSSGAKQALGEIMSNFRASIPDIAAGLGDIGAMLGHIAAAASHFLPGLSHGFADWARNLEKSVGSGGSLVHTIGDMVQNMRDFGHLAQDSGSFLVHFFGAATGAGDKLNNSLDHTVESWDKWAQSRHGEESLKSFFEESREGTEDFFSVLGGAAKLLFEFSRATAPVANGLLHIVTFIGNLVSAADGLAGVKTIFQGIGYALAGLYVGNKIANGISAIGSLAAKMGLIAGPEAAASASITANTAALEANTVAMEENAVATGEAGAAKGLDALATGADDAALALGGAEVGASGFGAALAGAAAAAAPFVVGGAILAGMVYLGTRTAAVQTHWEKLGEVFGEAAKESNKGIKHIEATTNKLAKTYDAEAKAVKNTAEARKDLNKLYKEGAGANKITAAVEKLNAAEKTQAQNTQQSAKARIQSVHAAKQQLIAEESLVNAAKARVEQVQKERTGGVSTRGGGRNGPQMDHEEAIASQELAQALHRQTEARRTLEVAQIANQRRSKELKPLNEQTVQGLNKLSKTIGGAAAQKIGNFVKPGQVAEITKLGNKLDNLGRGNQVKKISVQSQGADQTINKLKQLQKQTNRVEAARANVKVGANDTEAQSKLKRVSRLSQQLAGSNATIKILANSNNAEEAIHKLRAHLQQLASEKHEAQLSAIDKTGPAAAIAKRNLAQTANGKYSAELKAIDRASAPAAKAKSAADKVKGNYEAHISAPGAAQAAGQIQTVVNAISQLHDESVTITTNYVQHGSPPGNRATGGPMFAGGGSDTLLQTQQERAAARAITAQGGVPRRVTQPTYLVGEQAPSHPEYVLAMNPAYRGQNERYLEDAAGHLGKEVIPAYAKGKGNKNNKGGSSVQNRAEESPKIKDPGPPPTLKPWIHNYRSPTSVNHGGGIAHFNQLERDIANTEGQYQAELTKEEREISIYKNTGRGRSAWDFAQFKAWRTKMVKDEKEIKTKAIPEEIKDVGKVQHRAEAVWAQANGEQGNAKAHYRQAGKLLAKEENIYKHMRKSAHESSADFSDRKIKYSHEIDKQKAEVAKWKERISLLEEKKKEAKATETAAKQEIKALKEEAGPTATNNLAEQENQLAELGAFESGELETPYAEPAELAERGHPNTEPAELALIEAENNHASPEAIAALKHGVLEAAEKEFAYAKTTPGIADDIEAANEIKSAASALEEVGGAGGGAPSIAEQTATVNAARQQLYEQFASNITNTPAYMPGGSGASMFETPGSFSGSAPVGAGSGTVNNVTNNFAAPPPDPHTFSKNLEFELNA